MYVQRFTADHAPQVATGERGGGVGALLATSWGGAGRRDLRVTNISQVIRPHHAVATESAQA